MYYALGVDDRDETSARLVVPSRAAAFGQLGTGGRIVTYPRETEIIAELSFGDDANRSAALTVLVERSFVATYSAYELANFYDPRSYVKFDGVIAPLLLKLSPASQKDVLFSKRHLAK